MLTLEVSLKTSDGNRPKNIIMRIVNINFLLLECMTEIILWKIYGLVKPWACSSPLKARHKEALKVVVGGGGHDLEREVVPREYEMI